MEIFLRCWGRKSLKAFISELYSSAWVAISRLGHHSPKRFTLKILFSHSILFDITNIKQYKRKKSIILLFAWLSLMISSSLIWILNSHQNIILKKVVSENTFKTLVNLFSVHCRCTCLNTSFHMMNWWYQHLLNVRVGVYQSSPSIANYFEAR